MEKVRKHVLISLIVITVVSFLIWSYLKFKASGKTQDSSEYKRYKTFSKIAISFIAVIILTILGNLYAPEATKNITDAIYYEQRANRRL